MSHLRKIVASACTAVALSAGAANAQVVALGEAYNVVFFGEGSGSFTFGSPWANTVVAFDGVAEVAAGQPAGIFGPVGDPVAYTVTESQFANGDGTWTIRIQVTADGGFLAPGLDFDPLDAGVQPLNKFTFDLGATTFGTNNGIRGIDASVLFLSANVTWAAGETILSSVDATQRIALNLAPGSPFATGSGLRGQFSYIDPSGDIGLSGLDSMTLDIIVTPTPGAAGLLAAGGLLAARRRR